MEVGPVSRVVPTVVEIGGRRGKFGAARRAPSGMQAETVGVGRVRPTPSTGVRSRTMIYIMVSRLQGFLCHPAESQVGWVQAHIFKKAVRPQVRRSMSICRWMPVGTWI